MTIGWAAFRGCSALKSINISNNITEIRLEAFNGCFNLESINVAENNYFFKSVDGILFNKETTAIIRFAPKHKNTTYAIPNSVRDIQKYTF